MRLGTLVQRPIVPVHYEIDFILGFHLVIFHELVTHQPRQLFNFRSRQRFRREVSGFTFVTTFFVPNFSLLECASSTAEIMIIRRPKTTSHRFLRNIKEVLFVCKSTTSCAKLCNLRSELCFLCYLRCNRCCVMQTTTSTAIVFIIWAAAQLLHVGVFRLAQSFAVDQAHRHWSILLYVQPTCHLQVLCHALDRQPF